MWSVATFPHCKKVMVSNLSAIICVELCLSSVGYYGFLLQSNNNKNKVLVVRSIGESKFPSGVTLSVNSCLTPCVSASIDCPQSTPPLTIWQLWYAVKNKMLSWKKLFLFSSKSEVVLLLWEKVHRDAYFTVYKSRCFHNGNPWVVPDSEMILVW